MRHVDRDNWHPAVDRPQGPIAPPPWKRTRTDDPSTSFLAAAEAPVRRQYLEILHRLEQHEPCTYHSLIPANSAGRVTELSRQGYIECVGISDGKPRGRLWRRTELGRSVKNTRERD